MKKAQIILMLFSLSMILGCTDLERDLGSSLSREGASELINARQLVDANYQNLRGFATQDLIFALQEHTGDAVMGPTRGGDWDDNGVWRVLHQHTWDRNNIYILNTFNDLSGGVFQSIEALGFAEGPERGEALFLQSWFVLHLTDLFGQVAFREDLIDLSQPSIVLTGQEAIDLVISNLEEAIELLPETSDLNRANKNTARAFLAKVLLNKAVYEKEDRLPPFSFEEADLNRVVDLTNQVTGYSLESGIDYYQNFSPNNDIESSEIIFLQSNTRGLAGGNVASRWLMTLHYNNQPSGWNGFTTIADFYNKFEDGDVRKGNVDYPGLTDVSGLKAGFLQGQQFDEDGAALEDRLGNPLVFTVESPIIPTGDLLEISGVRGMKYIPDFENIETPENDFVLLRYPDVLLTQAEALFRLGQDGQALSIINNLRSTRGASALTNLSEDDIIDERGRELWWEGHRRTDLIRFGKFLDSWNEKDSSEGFRVLFPLPERAVSINPNLTQNPGY
jgi:hypothetical protein